MKYRVYNITSHMGSHSSATWYRWICFALAPAKQASAQRTEGWVDVDIFDYSWFIVCQSSANFLLICLVARKNQFNHNKNVFLL